MRANVSMKLVMCLVILALAASFVAAEQTIHVSASSLENGMDCAQWNGEWHFVINQIYTGDAPDYITITWENGASENVYLESFSGFTAHYTTTSNIEYDVIDATAVIYDLWSGNFVLSCTPTAVELTDFTARFVSSDRVLVEWETASEIDCLGFNIHRSYNGGMTWAKINSAIIPCKAIGGMTGAEYSYTDRVSSRYMSIKYILEQIDFSGTTDEYGPITVRRYVAPAPIAPRLPSPIYPKPEPLVIITRIR